MNNVTDLRNSRLAMENLACSLGTELIEATSVMTDDEVSLTVDRVRQVNRLLDNLMFDVLGYRERLDEG